MARTRTPARPHNLQRFSRNQDGALVAEASDLGGRFGLERIYDDACDVGIAIQSHHTNRIEWFYLDKREERDGEVLAWEFKPVSAGLHGAQKVVIFND